jgi:hypothetical protein
MQRWSELVHFDRLVSILGGGFLGPVPELFNRT